MKESVLASTFFIAMFIQVFAQDHDAIIGALQSTPEIKIEEQQLSFRNEVKPAFTLLLYCEADEYEKDFRNFLKSKFMVEEKKSSGYLEAHNVFIPEWHTDSISMFHKMEKDGDAVRLILHVESRGQFIDQNSFPESAQKISSAIKAQAKDFYIKYYDELIEEQQRNYDRQLRDQEKLVSAGVKLLREIESNKGEIARAENSIASATSKIKDNENESALLKQELDQKKRELDQGKKELDANIAQVNTKQKQLDTYNYKGEMASKDAIKVAKDLEKLRGSQGKLQSGVTDKNEEITKKENEILGNAREKTELESAVREEESTIGKKKNEISSLENEVNANESNKSDKQSLVDSAGIVLGKLKNAKAGLVAQQ